MSAQSLYVWHLQYSQTKNEGGRISCEMWRATVEAGSEAEAREVFGEEMPDMDLDKITCGDLVDFNAD